jgi:AcrR family transcriptional regulator
MKSSRIDIASIRKGQIVEAAVAVIAEQGLERLSLSEIETRAGMRRGQLTYYFKHKEDILLAVFDRVIQLMYERLGRPPGAAGDGPTSGWQVACYLLETMLTRPPLSPEFSCLQYTFLAQIGHREDFRRRLASLYDEWRSNMAAGLAADLARRNGTGNGRRRPSPRLLATLIQAMLHGLAMQLAADPHAFDGHEMLKLCQDVLGSYLHLSPPAPKSRANARPNIRANGKAPPRSRSRTKTKG